MPDHAAEINAAGPDYSAFAFETITVGTASTAPTSTVAFPSAARPARACYATLETNAIRFRYDGTAPAADTGHYLAATGYVAIKGAKNIANLKLIRDTGASGDGTLSVTYLR